MENPQHRVLSRHSTDPELEVHSVDFEEKPRTQRVERHAINTTCKFEKKPKIADFISASVHPSSNNQRPCKKNGYDNTTSEDITEESKSNKIELGYHFTFSDDDESVYHDKDGIGFSIYDSIRAIQKEASKIDAVLAVDQVDRLQEEMKQLRSELQRQSVKTEELSAQLQMKDGQIGTLELERDLYKADTNKLANDLECCLMKLRRVGGTSSPIEIGYGRSGIVATMNEINNSDEKEVSQSPPKLISADHKSDTSDPVSQLDQSTSPLLPPNCRDSPTGTSITTSSTQARTSSSTSPEMNENTDPITEHRVSAKPQNNPKQKGATAQRVSRHRDSDVETATSIQNRQKNKLLLFSLCRPQQKNRKVHASKIRSVNPMQKKTMNGSSQKRNNTSKPPNVKKSNPAEVAHLPSGLLQEQVQVMSQRLQSSIKTSEDLRRRIATVHYYYENQVHQLDERIMEACVERSKMEFEKSLRNTTMDGGKNEAHPESKPRNLDPRIQTARKSRVVTFNV